MNNEERFKSKLHDLLDEHYYTYDPGNWEKASEHLDQEDAKKRRRFLYFIFSGLGIGLAVLGYFLLTPAELSAPASREVAAVAPAASGKETEKTISAAPEKTQSTGHESLKENLRPEAKTPATEPETIQQQAKPITTARTPERIKEEEPAATQALPSLPLAAKGNSKPEKTEKTGQNEAPVTASTNEDEAGTNTSSPGSSAPSVAETKSAPVLLNNANDKKENPIQDESKDPGQAATSTPPVTEKKPEDVTPAVKKDSVAKTPAPVARPDSVVKAAVQPTLPIVPPVTNFCYIEAGVFYNFGWKNAGEKEGNSVNPYLGMSYLMHLTDKLRVSLGAYYTTLSGLEYTKVVKSSKVVFGEESTVTEITPLRANYIAIPLRLHYALDSKQMITAGYTAAYMLDVQSKIHKYDIKMGSRQNESTYRTGGYIEGFRTFSSQLSVGYRRQLYGGLWANLEYSYGLTDLRDDDFFGIQTKERNHGLKLSLTYDMIKK